MTAAGITADMIDEQAKALCAAHPGDGRLGWDTLSFDGQHYWRLAAYARMLGASGEDRP